MVSKQQQSLGEKTGFLTARLVSKPGAFYIFLLYCLCCQKVLITELWNNVFIKEIFKRYLVVVWKGQFFFFGLWTIIFVFSQKTEKRFKRWVCILAAAQEQRDFLQTYSCFLKCSFQIYAFQTKEEKRIKCLQFCSKDSSVKSKGCFPAQCLKQFFLLRISLQMK